MSIRNLFRLDGRTAIVTGASGLLGLVYVHALISQGARVLAIDKGPEGAVFERLNSKFTTEDKLKLHLEEYQLDITDEKQIQSFFNNLEKSINFKGVDILVNNASLVKQVGASDLEGVYDAFESQTSEDWLAYYRVDIIGSLLMVKYSVKSMKEKRRGSIVNISSTYGNVSPDQRLYESITNASAKIEKPIGYSISKSGVLNMTRHLATLYAEYGIRVNSLTPGGVYSNNPDSFVKAYSRRTPLGRMADKNEYAGPLIFLASDASSYMTGSNLIVDGGWTSW